MMYEQKGAPPKAPAWSRRSLAAPVRWGSRPPGTQLAVPDGRRRVTPHFLWDAGRPDAGGADADASQPSKAARIA